jgi:hypothetical protein
MAKWAFWAALAVGGLMAIQRFPVEQLLVPVLTIYLMIAGFLVMLFQKDAWSFLRPLLVVALALLFLPPLLKDLMRGLKQAVLELIDSLPLGWIFLPIVTALSVFVLFRLWNWRRNRSLRGPKKVFRERERVAPRFDPEDNSNNES